MPAERTPESTNERLEKLRQCEPKRVSTYGSFPWAIVHRPTGAIVEGPREQMDYGLGPRSINGPSYFARKKDAKAALDSLRAKASGRS